MPRIYSSIYKQNINNYYNYQNSYLNKEKKMFYHVKLSYALHENIG